MAKLTLTSGLLALTLAGTAAAAPPLYTSSDTRKHDFRTISLFDVCHCKTYPATSNKKTVNFHRDIPIHPDRQSLLLSNYAAAYGSLTTNKNGKGSCAGEPLGYLGAGCHDVDTTYEKRIVCVRPVPENFLEREMKDLRYLVRYEDGGVDWDWDDGFPGEEEEEEEDGDDENSDEEDPDEEKTDEEEADENGNGSQGYGGKAAEDHGGSYGGYGNKNNFNVTTGYGSHSKNNSFGKNASTSSSNGKNEAYGSSYGQHDGTDEHSTTRPSLFIDPHPSGPSYGNNHGVKGEKGSQSGSKTSGLKNTKGHRPTYFDYLQKHDPKTAYAYGTENPYYPGGYTTRRK